MAQVANYTVDNDTGANVRADINNIFAAVQSLNSGSSDPSGTQVAFQLSVNTTSNLLKLRNASNNGYIELILTNTVKDSNNNIIVYLI